VVRPYCYYFHVPLDIDIKLGQQFFVGFKGTTLSKKTGSFLEKIQPGGIVFFEENIRDKKQVKNLIRSIKSILSIKPFIAVDQEGGPVERLRRICTSLSSPWGLGKVGLKELLLAHEIIASELSELGFNMNFAPVLDINSNPENPVIGTRAISADPETVNKYGNKIIELYMKHNIIPVAKHFPGHGDLNIDSHFDLPILNKSKKELFRSELIPFINAIHKKVPCIMIGHIYLPKLEKEKNKPASISKNITTKLLRNELGYKGLILTDELNMKGVTKNYPLNTATFHALKAGADLLLLNQNEELTLNAFNYLRDAVHKDKSLVQINNKAYKRIISIKNTFIDRTGRLFKKDLSNHEKISEELAQKTVHWYKRDLFLKPLKPKSPVEIIYPESPKLREVDLKAICKKLRFDTFRLTRYKINPSSKEINKITARLNYKRNIVIITYDIACRKGQKKLVNRILKKHRNLIVIAAGLEQDLRAIPNINSFIAAFAPNFISLYAAFKKLLL